MKNDIIIFCAKYLVFIVALIAVAYWVRLNKNRKIQLAWSVVAGVIAALVLAKVAGKFYYHPRPFVVDHIKPLVAHGNDNGFPSEHTAVAMTLATVLYFYRRKLAAGLFVLSVLVGLGRIWAHVHSPLDILGGLVIGLVGGLIGYYLVEYLRPTQKPAAKK